MEHGQALLFGLDGCTNITLSRHVEWGSNLRYYGGGVKICPKNITFILHNPFQPEIIQVLFIWPAWPGRRLPSRHPRQCPRGCFPLEPML